jgi:hypothetical protein
MRIAAVFLVLAALAMSVPSWLSTVTPAAAVTGEAATEKLADVAADAPIDAGRNAAKGPTGDAVGVPSDAPPVDDVFRSFGLFGTWAADCGRPASPDNPHVHITAPSAGLVLENNDVGPDYAANRYSVLSARRLSADRLEVTVIFRPGAPGEERQTLVFAVGKGTRRTMYNRVEGGAVRVRNGVVLTLGIKTPVLKKCG